VRDHQQRHAFLGLPDLRRADVRFINRQAGSGTRLLLEGLLREQRIEPTAVASFEQGEFTHAAVAAFVASGMADVGFGLEPPGGSSGSTFCRSPANATFCSAAPSSSATRCCSGSAAG
jgi:molybdate-binding protein